MSQFDASRVLRDDKGRFAGSLPSAESGVDLAATIGSQPYSTDAPLGHREAWRDARAALLARAGYVPATSTTTKLDPKIAGDDELRAKWWANEFVTAEYDHEKGDYPQMPDDYTPGGTGGRALSGGRRTHRMNYSGGGLDLRMPSATAARRFAKEHNGRTFDMPVQAKLPSGRSVQGWVRCTPGANGRWETESIGFQEGPESETISEGVNAVLESRRVTTALRDAGDLAQRREQRLAQRGISHTPVKSSWIQSAGYQDPTEGDNAGMMVMKTKPYMTKGRTRKDGTVISSPEPRPSREYGFAVSKETFSQFARSTEPGKTFNELIKGKHDRFDVTQCSSCSRFHRSDQAHSCGPAAQPRQVDQSVAAQREMQRAAAAQMLPTRRSRFARLFGGGSGQ